MQPISTLKRVKTLIFEKKVTNILKDQISDLVNNYQKVVLRFTSGILFKTFIYLSYTTQDNTHISHCNVQLTQMIAQLKWLQNLEKQKKEIKSKKFVVEITLYKNTCKRSLNAKMCQNVWDKISLPNKSVGKKCWI